MLDEGSQSHGEIPTRNTGALEQDAMTVCCLHMSPYNITVARAEPKLINLAKHELTLLEQYSCLCTMLLNTLVLKEH